MGAGCRRFRRRSRCIVTRCPPEPHDRLQIPNLSSRKALPSIPPSLVFSHPEAETILRDFLKTKLSLSDEEAAAILDQVRGSFLGFYDTLSWFVGDSVPEGEIAVVLEKLNEMQE